MIRAICFLFALAIAPLLGCSNLGVRNPLFGESLTGGSEAATSKLLDISLPPGMERYSAHGYQTYGAHGGREGLESLRGNIDMLKTAQSIHVSLVAQGWQLRLSLRKGDRIVQVYEREKALALLNFRRQTVMTILEIWTGGRLADGSMPTFTDGGDAQTPLEGGNDPFAPVPGSVEKWGTSSGGGSSRLQERPL